MVQWAGQVENLNGRSAVRRDAQHVYMYCTLTRTVLHLLVQRSDYAECSSIHSLQRTSSAQIFSIQCRTWLRTWGSCRYFCTEHFHDASGGMRAQCSDGS